MLLIVAVSRLLHVFSFYLITFFFFFNDTATTEIYTLSLHDALPISRPSPASKKSRSCRRGGCRPRRNAPLEFHARLSFALRRRRVRARRRYRRADDCRAAAPPNLQPGCRSARAAGNASTQTAKALPKPCRRSNAA